ncbi:hypothetical protein M405DRAFT_817525, partial [Rhizopogon salebrosus TDB-379]
IKADSSQFRTGVVWIHANDLRSVERRAFVTTLARWPQCSCIWPRKSTITLHEGDEGVSHISSVEWNDSQAEQDMASLLKMHSVVLSLLEKARGDKHLKNYLEAEPYFLQLIEREITFLKTLFIVSDANITDEGSLGTGSFAWSYVSTMAIPDTDTNMEVPIRVRPSSLSKCPWCWTDVYS